MKFRRSPSNGAYLRWLHLSQAGNQLPDVPGFGVNEKALFDALIVAWSRGQPMTVRQAIEIKSLGSRVTLHTRLLRLRKMGMIAAVAQEHDLRLKYLLPSEKGIQYLTAMAKLFSKVKN